MSATTQLPTRCCLCGRFMDEDQIMLGCMRDYDDAYCHWECVKKLGLPYDDKLGAFRGDGGE